MEDEFVDCEVDVEESETPGIVHTGNRSCHERIVLMTIDDRTPDSFIHVVANNVALHVKRKSRTGWCGTARSHPSAVFLVH